VSIDKRILGVEPKSNIKTRKVLTKMRPRMSNIFFRLAIPGVLAFLFAVFNHVGTASAAVCDPSASVHITGSITSQNGAGVGNVTVTANAAGASTAEYGPCFSLTNGTYEIDVAPGTYDLHFNPPSTSNLNPVIDTTIR
jgi:hypothetical protein